MGKLLCQAKAWEQALPILQRAHALFPKRQVGLADGSVYPLVLTLFQLGQAQQAHDVAQAELVRLVDDEARGPSQRALAHIQQSAPTDTTWVRVNWPGA